MEGAALRWAERREARRIMASTAVNNATAAGKRQPPDDLMLDLYKRMLRIYYVEERMKVFVKQGKCPFYASTRGHEAVQAGFPLLMKPRHDWFYTYYREKGVAIALGLDLKEVFLGMLNREGDPNSGGVNMPEHFSSRELNLVTQTACTGTQYLPAVGMAKAVKHDGEDRIVYVSSGEGATSEGEFFESVNWACREKLPVVFVIQNNGYAISVPQEVQTSSEIHRMAAGFGLASYRVDGTKFEPLYELLPDMLERIRKGEGPALVECNVVRIDSHSSSDDQRKYRTEEELAEALKRDPVAHTEDYVLRQKLLTKQEVEDLRGKIREEVDKAAAEADEHPFPEPVDLSKHIFSANLPVTDETEPKYVSDTAISVVQALNNGLKEEMERNPKIVMWGEDIGDPKGGVFGVTRGLGEAFPGRVVNSPLAEASICGVAGGMAHGGYKPIVEIQFGDYIWPGFMQLRNEIATTRWRGAGTWECPVVVRVAVGGYIKGGPWHSACIETYFSHIPGWYVVFPSSADDAKGLIKTAARCEDPVLFMEHKGLYRKIEARAPEPDDSYLIPFGKARVRREGTDLTIVTWGSTTHLAMKAAEQLEEEQDYSVEVIDLRTIIPWDRERVMESVRKTNRVMVAHEDTLTMGFGAEIAASIGDECFDWLDAPLVRVGAFDSWVPSATTLENAALPSVEDVRKAAERVLAY